MNAKLILKNLPKVEDLKFDSTSKCFVGRLLMPNGRISGTPCWHFHSLFKNDLTGLSKDVKKRVEKYDLSPQDLLLLSDTFEGCGEDESLDEWDGYNAVVKLLKKMV